MGWILTNNEGVRRQHYGKTRQKAYAYSEEKSRAPSLPILTGTKHTSFPTTSRSRPSLDRWVKSTVGQNPSHGGTLLFSPGGTLVGGWSSLSWQRIGRGMAFSASGYSLHLLPIIRGVGLGPRGLRGMRRSYGESVARRSTTTMGPRVIDPG